MARSKPSRSARVWLLKTEPSSFSFEDLMRAPKRRTAWSGVRNYQARNFLRDDFAPGDLVLVYHSSSEPAGVAGLARVVGAAEPDPTQFDPADEHFDPASKRASPTWVQVVIEGLAPLARFVPLETLKKEPRLARMLVVQRGQRLSVQPVQEGEARVVLELGGLDPAEFLR
jgi:predicted RNA-binding protein with PUA-like domain